MKDWSFENQIEIFNRCIHNIEKHRAINSEKVQFEMYYHQLDYQAVTTPGM